MSVDVDKLRQQLYVIVRDATRLRVGLYKTGMLYTIGDLLSFDYDSEELYDDVGVYRSKPKPSAEMWSLTPFVWTVLNLYRDRHGHGVVLTRYGVLKIKFLPPVEMRT